MLFVLFIAYTTAAITTPIISGTLAHARGFTVEAESALTTGELLGLDVGVGVEVWFEAEGDGAAVELV